MVGRRHGKHPGNADHFSGLLNTSADLVGVAPTLNGSITNWKPS
jgi:hypothetical protein